MGSVWLTAGMAKPTDGGPVRLADMSVASRITGENACSMNRWQTCSMM